MRSSFAALLAAALLHAPSVQAGVTVLRGATVHTLGAAGTLENATVIVRDGRIEQVGTQLAAPAGATIIEVQGKVITPGFIDAYGKLGVDEVDGEESTVDGSAKGLPYSAAFALAEAIDTRSARVEANRAEGITGALVAPSSSAAGEGLAPVISGQAAFIRLGSDTVARGAAGFVFTYGEAGAARSGGARSAALLRLRELLEDARDYGKHRGEYDRGARRAYAGTRLDLEALQPLLAGQVPLLVEVNRASDILAVLKLAQGFGLRVVIVGGAEAWRVAPALAAAKSPVILDALANLPDRFESLGATLQNAARLAAAGVEVAFATEDDNNPRNARQLAGNAVAHGMPYQAALAALTRVPARVAGLGDTLGTLEPGRLADLVVWDGDPFETTTTAERVYIGGEPMPTVSRQTLLRDRYRNLGGPLPPAYRKP
jgi:imidazolonepropionase-like amidohydrolase